VIPRSHRPAAGWLSPLLTALLPLSLAAQAELPAPIDVECSSSKSPSKDGNLTLSWKVGPELADALANGELAFTIEEQSEGERFEIDAGPFASSALSGREDGDYTYRVRARRADGSESAWSAPIEARVEHHSLWLALTLFGLGGAVFLATAALILVGNRRSRDADAVTGAR